jgi:hypothetical protein
MTWWPVRGQLVTSATWHWPATARAPSTRATQCSTALVTLLGTAEVRMRDGDAVPAVPSLSLSLSLSLS